MPHDHILHLNCRRVILPIAERLGAILVRTEERERDLHLPASRAVDDGHEPRVAAPPGERGDLADGRRRKANGFVPSTAGFATPLLSVVSFAPP
jgi:hypothetical protein